jgi:hypothetical protein
MSTLTDLLAQYEADRQFLRRFTLPQEARALVTDTPWPGGYRWFRSPNVVCLEKVRAILRQGREIEPHGNAA